MSNRIKQPQLPIQSFNDIDDVNGTPSAPSILQFTNNQWSFYDPTTSTNTDTPYSVIEINPLSSTGAFVYVNILDYYNTISVNQLNINIINTNGINLFEVDPSRFMQYKVFLFTSDTSQPDLTWHVSRIVNGNLITPTTPSNTINQSGNYPLDNNTNRTVTYALPTGNTSTLLLYIVNV